VTAIAPDLPRQLVLDLPVRAVHGREDFIVTGAGAAAVAAVESHAAGGSGLLVLCGPEGAGKSHLAAVWAGLAGAPVLAAADLHDPAGLIDLPALAVDGADRPASETALFHIVNASASRGGRLLLTGRLPPSRWPLALPDLASRLIAAPLASLPPADDRLLSLLLVKLFADRQLAVQPGVVTWLLRRIGRSHAEARAAVDLLDQAALAAGRAVTLDLARRTLADRHKDSSTQGKAS
jgi:chromosomal replication initiation ATPase DnaA